MSEPVEYQMRMRPTWESTSFSDWKKCSRDAFDDYTKTPKLHEWEYEVRKLYTSPPPQRTWVGLTDEDIFSVLGNLQAIYNRPPTEDSRIIFARAIEAKLKKKNT